MFVQKSSPQTEVSSPGQLVQAQLATQHDPLLEVPDIVRVELLEVVLDGRHVGLVVDPEPRTAQSAVRRPGTKLAHHVALGPHRTSLPFPPVERKVSRGHLLVVDLVVVINQLRAEEDLTHGVVSQGLALLANDDDIVAVPHVFPQLGRLLETFLTGRALEKMMVRAFLLVTALS